MSIKIGIIGAGGMLRYHAAGFKSAGAEIVAVADVNEAAAQAVAAREGIARSFGDVALMLRACPEIDAVSVIVPNKFHAPVSLQALAAGKHVFCEKPPALNVKEAAEMAALAKAKNLTLMFNFNNRARPESYAMMEYIKQGQVGRINSAQAKWIRRTGIPGLGGWFTNKALAGGGPLIDLVHMLDLALYFMGYPEPEFVLAQNPEADFKNAFDELKAALARGEKVTSVSGRLDGWSGRWPEMLKKLPAKPRRILVTRFEVMKNSETKTP